MLFAYLDAGSGSLILQAVLGGIAGIVVAGRAWKARLLGKKSDRGGEDSSPEPQDEPSPQSIRD